ncbi:MAG: GNAT family protein [Acidobacteriota bacterium]
MSIDWREGLPVLRLAGALLREPRLVDAPRLFASLTAPAVAKFLSTPPDSPFGFERFIGWVQHERQHGRHVCYAIVPEGSADPVGLVQAREIEPGFGTAEWGFALDEAWWGSGLFTKCATAMADFVFRHVGVHRLEARASVKNGRGNGVLQKIGAVPEGVLRRSFDNGTRVTDQVLWSLIAAEWLVSHPDLSYRLEDPLTLAPELLVTRPGTGRSETWTRGLPELQGNQVTLRELRASDASSLTKAFADTEVSRYIPPPPGNVRAFERFVEWARVQREAGSYFCYVVIPDGERRPVGLFQVHQLEPPFRSAEWGFVFARPQWGTGVFTRSACVLLDYVFEWLGVKRLEARAVADNARANGVLRKLGAVEEGRLRRSFLLGGQYHDDVLWSILDTDWAERRRRTRPSDGPAHP